MIVSIIIIITTANFLFTSSSLMISISKKSDLFCKLVEIYIICSVLKYFFIVVNIYTYTYIDIRATAAAIRVVVLLLFQNFFYKQLTFDDVLFIAFVVSAFHAIIYTANADVSSSSSCSISIRDADATNNSSSSCCCCC